MSIVSSIWKSKIWFLITLVILAAINWLASVYHTRIDFTNEKRFTLSAPTKKVLQKLDSVVQVDVFLTGDFPRGFKKLANSTNEILSEFKEIAGKKFQYNFISPDENVDGTNISWADTLGALGFYPINLTSQIKEGQQQQNIYPVAFVHYKQNVLPVMLYQGKTKAITYPEINSAEAMMEFNFISAIDKLLQKEKPIVGYTVGNGEPTGYNVEDLVRNTLQQEYQFYTINPNTQRAIPKEFNVLFIVKPAQPFSDEAKLKIDQYVMNGGKVLFFLDKLNAELDSLQSKKGEVVAYEKGLELNDMLFKYGARINSDLVMDLQCDFLPFDVSGNGQFELLPWNYFPVFESKSNHVINKNLGFVSGRFVNSIDTVEAAGIKKTILLSSSPNARTIATPALISVLENVSATENEKFKRVNIPVAVLLEGRFRSLFSNRLSQAMNDSLQKIGAVFVPQSITDNKMIIVADGDIILNSVVKGNQAIPMGMNPFTFGSQREFAFANKDFLKNCLDYLINKSNLAEAKAKDYTLRLLDKKKVDAQKTTWQLVNILVPVIIIILFALAYQLMRRKKYTRA